ncbi:MAG: zinc ribbon domain-containing protein [Candidatus Binatus sp.]|uniref:hypothetical protein n=1 Tax=Candidatus Binatus sp. TaxID=2811406 RepID=UPI003BB05E99
MPACGQCGKDNPEGTAFCGYCATPLIASGSDPGSSSTPGGKPIVSPQIRGGSSPAPKPSKPEIRTPTFHTPSSSGGGGRGKGGFELLPWNELSSNQKAGRVVAGIVVLFLIFFFFRTILRGLVGGRGTIQPAPSADGSNAPITEGDRKDGIESLCKVFQIYGLPKNDHDATDAAHNAAELFKLAGNQSPERSNYILTSIVGEFRSGKLGQANCADAGAPLPTTEETPDNSSPDIRRDSSQ